MLKSIKSGRLIVISSPSGAGKTTIAKKLVSKKKNIELSISVTTRNPRINEIPNKDYIFVDKKYFKKLIKRNSFLEYAKVFGNYYGTLKEPIIKKINKNHTIILDIDWQGARQIKKKLKNLTTTIFILPPSLKELKNRLKKREVNNKFINDRMSKAKREITHWKEYDYIVINDKLNICIKEIKTIINVLNKKPKNLIYFS